MDNKFTLHIMLDNKNNPGKCFRQEIDIPMKDSGHSELSLDLILEQAFVNFRKTVEALYKRENGQD